MSELRDLTSALASFSGSMSAIEECMVELAQASKRQEDFEGRLWKYLERIEEQVVTLRAVVQDNQKSISQRVRAVEPEEERTPHER